MDANAYERLVERARSSHRRLAETLEEMDEVPVAHDRRQAALKSRTAELVRALRHLIAFRRDSAETRSAWRRRVAEADVAMVEAQILGDGGDGDESEIEEELPEEELPEQEDPADFEFEPPY